MIYNIHIPCFLLLSITRIPPKIYSLSGLKSLFFARITPAVQFSFFSFLAYSFFLPGLNLSIFVYQVSYYFLAILLGSYWLFDTSTGLEIFWYVYAYAGLAAIYCSYYWLLPKSILLRLPIICVLCLCGSFFSNTGPTYFPAWLIMPLYIFPLLLSARSLILLAQRFSIFMGSLGGFIELLCVLSISLLWSNSHSYNIAHLRVPPVWDWSNYAILVILIASAFSFILRLSRCPVVFKAFSWLGVASMGIYLSHQYFLQIYYKVFMAFNIHSEYYAVILLALTLASSFAATRLISSLRNAVLPRS